MTAQHTPGPWLSCPEPTTRQIRIVAGFAGHTRVASLHYDRDDEAGDIARANARLIAAAPAMLAALQAAILDSDSTGCDGCALISAEFIMQMESAIATATDRPYRGSGNTGD